jgi:hypothetical protein
VLNSIYGVDVNPIAIEIAKLRVWLKMVEEGWETSYGELPNIDVNIVDGNSLIGLPARSSGQSILKAFDIDISSIQKVREEYKNGEISRRELNDRVDKLKPRLREKFLDESNHYLEERIETPERWNELVDDLNGLYSSFRKITVRRSNEEEFTDDQKEHLKKLGFSIETRYGKSAKLEEEDIDDIGVRRYTEILEEDYVFDVERQPVLFDLEQLNNLKNREDTEAVSYEPFHWPVEFPEVAVSNGSGYDVEFDLVVGNPPYGDLLTDVEKKFTEGYDTASINEIVAPFFEREIQIMNEGGYFGNIATMRFMYQTHADTARDVIRNKLLDTRIGCFTRRPTQVFDGSQPRSAIITGRKEENERESVDTSRFLRFTEEEREEIFKNISYKSTEGLTLGDKIGGGKDKSMPKVGTEKVKELLEILKENEVLFSDKMSRKPSDQTPHEVWRREGMSYFVNPLLENLYPPEDKPREVKPMYFDNELERKAGFLSLQTSLYYVFWMAYGNERHLPWKLIDGFPFPEREKLEGKREEVIELADLMWSEMSNRFKGGSRETIKNSGVLKPLCDRADDLIGPMYGLSESQVEYVKRYDEKYRLNDIKQEQLVDFDI